MIKIIETNASCDDNFNIVDFQSRVIEIDSWEDYIQEIETRQTVNRNAFIGGMHGVSFPKNADIIEIKSDNRRLFCKFKIWNGSKMIKMTYVI